ncbi:glycosyltransferase family 2 protein [Nocardia carnea]|uniref:glycosyltransferase family 2 protein n=1 Tax=Nocardia carnea TaxID=37328 RepID=UPI0024567CDB|nr:glycosyltransferase [Nocardia carnea]
MPDQTVAALVITYHSSEDLPAYLTSLEAAVHPLNLEIIGVDNASSDDSAEKVEHFGGRVARNTEISACLPRSTRPPR